MGHILVQCFCTGLSGRTDFLFSEVLKTYTYICPEYKMDYVFAREEENAVAIA